MPALEMGALVAGIAAVKSAVVSKIPSVALEVGNEVVGHCVAETIKKAVTNQRKNAYPSKDNNRRPKELPSIASTQPISPEIRTSPRPGPSCAA